MRAGTGLFGVVVAAALSVGAAGQESPGGLEKVIGYVPVSEEIATAGQITTEQIPLLKDEGFDVVVNLATADQDRNGQEGFLVSQLGLTYVQIPVIFSNPTERDLETFFKVMNAVKGQKVLVHCFANMRASAFTYLYRVKELGEPPDVARPDMEKLWTAEAWARYPQWAEFVRTHESK